MNMNRVLLVVLVCIVAVWAGAQVCEFDWGHEIGQASNPDLANPHVEFRVVRDGLVMGWYPQGWGTFNGWSRAAAVSRYGFRPPVMKSRTINGERYYYLGLPFVVLAVLPAALLAWRWRRWNMKPPQGFDMMQPA